MRRCHWSDSRSASRSQSTRPRPSTSSTRSGSSRRSRASTMRTRTAPDDHRAGLGAAWRLTDTPAASRCAASTRNPRMTSSSRCGTLTAAECSPSAVGVRGATRCSDGCMNCRAPAVSRCSSPGLDGDAVSCASSSPTPPCARCSTRWPADIAATAHAQRPALSRPCLRCQPVRALAADAAEPRSDGPASGGPARTVR